MKKRILFHEIVRYLDRKEALVITGMRQVGKTTLMRQIFDTLEKSPRVWFDFENPLDAKRFEGDDYESVYERLQEKAGTKKDERFFVFIDEMQVFPEVTKIIKYCIDHHGVKFVVTGSSNYYLKNLFPESLSGRKFLFHLPPLSFQEYLYFKDKISNADIQPLQLEDALSKSSLFLHEERETEYDDFVRFGGFPAVVLAEDKETKHQILKNIFASFFEKDLRVLSDYKDVQELRDFLLLLVPRVGSFLDITRISSELGISRAKVYQFLEFLEGTFVVRIVPRYAKGADRAVAGRRKVYFSDTGILSLAGEINEGQLFENAVINQLALYGETSVYYKRNKEEIEVIVNKKHAFEIKVRGIDRDYQKLIRIAQKLELSHYTIISRKFVDKEGFASPTIL